ncbi:MAG: multidrug effflux MFS transporter [Candidatus Jidaibacter sp.]|jgi:Bcr/CflA subfamily drug resistance transporter|nr:multidrug effflux MFS transporter [Candidatus Jidaibacter sp.]
MINPILPSIWLIVLVIGFPKLAETVYTPSLPDIAVALQTSETVAEYTITIYLLGFAFGVLFWGNLSDRIGRKPCILAGLTIFILGCIGCYFSNAIEVLMGSRLIQAFGGSVGSVMGQAICRDSFHGATLGRAYSSIGSALAIFPAVGPVIGGVIAGSFGWASNFLFLTLFTIALTILIIFKLPETHHASNRKRISMMAVVKHLIHDKKVIGFGLIIAAGNGISFSYFAEGSFYLIKLLGLSPSEYGLGFMPIAFSTMLGGMLSKKLHSTHSSASIMSYGLYIVLSANFIFSLIILYHTFIVPIPTHYVIALTILMQMGSTFGGCMAMSNALALALVDYKWCIGTASSLFGAFYYCLISGFTLIMGALHNGTLLQMPLYFLTLSLFMMLVKKLMWQTIQ